MAFPVIPERLRAAFDQHTPGFWSWWQAAQTKLNQMELGILGNVPAGTIIGWSGYLANHPTGWAVCDGTNGTPDLTANFIE